jgi:hypothetical protein
MNDNIEFPSKITCLIKVFQNSITPISGIPFEIITVPSFKKNGNEGGEM